MSEEALVDPIFVRLEPQVQDYVDVRNPKTTAYLLEVLVKFEERYSCKKMRARGIEIMLNDESGNRVQSENFSGGDSRNRGSSTNFSRKNQRKGGRLNVLRFLDDQNDELQSEKDVPVKLSAMCMSPVKLPYVPVLLDETFRKALGDIGAEKSFISEAQGAKCRNIGIIELNMRIREFVKTLMFHVLADLKYPCILGVDFISGSKIVLDFDRKVLAIPDSQIKKVVTTIEEGNVEMYLTKTGLEESQKQELHDLFNSFQGLFYDKPKLTHVLYHDIDTGDKPPVVSSPYRYDTVKQSIIDYHAEKIMKERTIMPIESPYASLVVLCRKNNGLPPDYAEA
ncbi:uncharacterized protein TNCV_4331261 [Trichonephila clavipes]|nr:uncharacterized protein TNCV_4331261 [Trichonephila clavipes]